MTSCSAPSDRAITSTAGSIVRVCGGCAIAALLMTTGVTQGAAQGSASGLNVVVTSKPAHSLVAAVMQGVGVPHVLVDGAASPHTYAMKPSDAQKVQHADVFFRVSQSLEPFTQKVMQSLPNTVMRVTLADSAGVVRLPRRTNGTFERHVHRAGEPRHAADDSSGDADPHVWLDPANARAMTMAIAAALSQRRPESADRFATNAADLAARIDALQNELALDLAPVQPRPFVVFHDAIQYFEARFGLNAVGSITLSPDVQPSARRLSDVRAKVHALSAACVFGEPNLPPRAIAAVTEGTSARTGVLDPEGTLLAPGPELYSALMRNLAASLKACLTP